MQTEERLVITAATGLAVVVVMSELARAFTNGAQPTKTGYAWQYGEFTGPWYEETITNIASITPTPVLFEPDPSKDALRGVISNPDNAFYSHYTHGGPCTFLTYGSGRGHVTCTDIREWMKDRPPFRFALIINCLACEETSGGDSLQKAFSKDFADPKTVLIGGPNSTGTPTSMTRFSYLFAGHPDTPLHDMFLASAWENRSEWDEEYPHGHWVLNNARFYGSQSTTPAEVFI